MNSFELNKIFGAILGALVFVMGVGFIAEAIYRPIENRGATYELPEPEIAEGQTGPVVQEIEPIAVRMQTASAEAGERLMNRCQSCHDYSEANANRTGPGIYNIMGEVIAHHDDFNYSDALIALREQGEVWDYQHMDDFLASPRNFAPGTRMTFAGLSNPQDRANMIAFLRTLSPNPIDLPEVSAEDVVEDEADANDASAAEADDATSVPAEDPAAIDAEATDADVEAEAEVAPVEDENAEAAQ